MTPIVLSFRYSKEDVVRAMRAHYSSALRLRIDGALAILLLAVGIYWFRSPDSKWPAIFCFIASGALLLILVAAFVLIPHLVFSRQSKYRDDYSLTFSDGGIHFRTVHIDSQLQWNLYTHALVNAHSYLLYYGSRTFTIIPKRVFRGQEQQAEFDKLLSQNVTRIVRKNGSA